MRHRFADGKGGLVKIQRAFEDDFEHVMSAAGAFLASF